MLPFKSFLVESLLTPPPKGEFKHGDYDVEVDTFSHGDEPKTDYGDFIGKVRAKKDGKVIGSASVYRLPGGKMRGEYLHVDKEHRGKGIGNAMYDSVESHHNTTMVPSSLQDDDGKRFWEKRKARNKTPT